jgi:hypothetical protein
MLLGIPKHVAGHNKELATLTQFIGITPFLSEDRFHLVFSDHDSHGFKRRNVFLDILQRPLFLHTDNKAWTILEKLRNHLVAMVGRGRAFLGIVVRYQDLQYIVLSYELGKHLLDNRQVCQGNGVKRTPIEINHNVLGF